MDNFQWLDLIVLVFPLIGVVWVYGTWKNWKVLMDPSDVLWFMWLWHLVRKHFGEGGMKVLNYGFSLSPFPHLFDPLPCENAAHRRRPA